jgi:Tol biopolymer transport system component/DNA-binding winged helix-turn-helix (wHTH) protein
MDGDATRVASRLQFGSFELDPATRELRKHGLKIKLSPQALCVLVRLLENPGKLVRREELVEMLWPGNTFVEFEGNLNAIVRVLREALGDSARNPRFVETEPRMGYRFIAPVSTIPQGKTEPPLELVVVSPSAVTPPRRTIRPAAWPIALMTLALPAGWWMWRAYEESRPPRQTQSRQITYVLGFPGHPTFSPDGTQVAFHWDGGQKGEFNIYILRIGSGNPQRLTSGPADDRDPVWSPDGRDIAFRRTISDSESTIVFVPAMGGSSTGSGSIGGERTVARVDRLRSLAWSADGKWIAYSQHSPQNEAGPDPREGIHAISLSSGETIRITPPGSGDGLPAFSRDGRQLALVRSGDVWVVPLDAHLKLAGAPRRVTFGAKNPRDPLWMSDGQSLIYSAERGAHRKLWWVSTVRNGSPVELGGEDVFEPALDASGTRVVYSQPNVVDSLNSLELCNRCGAEPPKRLLSVTKLARNPACSPDGRQIAFESSGSGDMEIWICDRDGGNPRQLTHMGGASAGTPNWSPDGKEIVFDADVGRKSGIYVIPASGGASRQLTTGAAPDLVPIWSHDGRRIYFASKRTGVLEVWSMTRDGEDAVQITRGGGFRPVESADGRYVYYSKGSRQTSIWRVPAGGGEELPLVGSLDYWQNFSATPVGIYYVPTTRERGLPIRFFDFDAGTSRPAGQVESASLQGVSACGDGGLVFSRRESSARDLMLMEIAQ